MSNLLVDCLRISLTKLAGREDVLQALEFEKNNKIHLFL